MTTDDRSAEPGWWGVVVIVLVIALAAYLIDGCDTKGVETRWQ